jgi:phosphoglycerate dehydrogenase-like enzyme
MTETEKKPARLVIAMNYSDELVAKVREAAPHYRVERHFPEVPANVWADTEILYTLRALPTPEQAPHLRWIQLHSAGVDVLVGNAILQRPEIQITTASGIHAVQIAEYCLAMMLAFNVQIPRMLDLQQKAEWPTEPHKIFSPRTLRGQTLGIHGYGSIGRELARLASAMGMRVLATKFDAMHTEDTGYTEPDTGDPRGELPERIYPGQALGSMVRDCDYLVVAAPLTEGTRHSVDAEVLEQMKSTAVLINIARGALVDQPALISALHDNKIRGAGLDVFEQEPLPKDSPLWKMKNVILSPHVSGNTITYNQKTAALFVENLKRFVEKRPLLNLLNKSRLY